jgi:hypothetical protein
MNLSDRMTGTGELCAQRMADAAMNLLQGEREPA